MTATEAMKKVAAMKNQISKQHEERKAAFQERVEEVARKQDEQTQRIVARICQRF